MTTELLTTREAAELIGSTANSLTSLRSEGRGPAYVLAGAGRSRVRYTREDLLAYAAARSPGGVALADRARRLREAKEEGPTG